MAILLPVGRSDRAGLVNYQVRESCEARMRGGSSTQSASAQRSGGSAAYPLYLFSISADGLFGNISRSSLR